MDRYIRCISEETFSSGSGRSIYMSTPVCGPFGLRAGLRLAILLISICAVVTYHSTPVAAAPATLPKPPTFIIPKLPFGSKFHLLDATIDEVQTAIRLHQLTCT